MDADGHLHFLFSGYCESNTCGLEVPRIGYVDPTCSPSLGCAACEPGNDWLARLYATDTGAPYQLATVEGECLDSTVPPEGDGQSDSDLSFAVARDGQAHATWFDASADEFLYATGGASGWTVSSLTPATHRTAAWDNVNDIAIDSVGRPHVVTFNEGTFAVRYFTKVGATWESATIAAPAAYPRVTISPNDDVHVLYDVPFAGRNELYVATRGAGAAVDEWRSSLVDSVAGDIPGDIALEASGRVHLAYYEGSSGLLKLAAQDSTGGGPGPETGSLDWSAIAEYQSALDASLPRVETATDGKQRKIAKRLARLDRKSDGALAKARNKAGKKQTALFRKARAALQRLLGVARKADQKGRLTVSLAAVEANVNALLERIPA